MSVQVVSYRKRPVVISAARWSGEAGDRKSMESWLNLDLEWSHDDEGMHLRIPSLNGHSWARPGDFIVVGEYGQAFPVKADIFEATYEAV